MRMLHPKMLTSGMTGSELVWTGTMASFAEVMVCFISCTFLACLGNMEVKYNREDCSSCILSVLGVQTVGIPLCK